MRYFFFFFPVGSNSQGTQIEMNRAGATLTVLHTERGGKGRGTHCSHKQGLEMNTQILPSETPASAVLLLLCTCICVCKCVITGQVGLWGNKSALSSWSGTKWLRKQAELWFYSLMFVNNIYNRGFSEHRLGRTGRFDGTLASKTNQETETDCKIEFSANKYTKAGGKRWPEIISHEGLTTNFYFPPLFSACIWRSMINAGTLSNFS